eukprot:TRINITY_DN28501_c0_g1_i1.p1 TRINITY_DN28501_c0_g1~~TRINITY_DN28501_c0_g1_i1.p1  ORF type:complete len:932 (+),score=202.15 TRINITY_DN28501_c0_g1_i1:41-2836(+)
MPYASLAARRGANGAVATTRPSGQQAATMRAQEGLHSEPLTLGAIEEESEFEEGLPSGSTDGAFNLAERSAVEQHDAAAGSPDKQVAEKDSPDAMRMPSGSARAFQPAAEENNLNPVAAFAPETNARSLSGMPPVTTNLGVGSGRSASSQQLNEELLKLRQKVKTMLEAHRMVNGDDGQGAVAGVPADKLGEASQQPQPRGSAGGGAVSSSAPAPQTAKEGQLPTGNGAGPLPHEISATPAGAASAHSGAGIATGSAARQRRLAMPIGRQTARSASPPKAAGQTPAASSSSSSGVARRPKAEPKPAPPAKWGANDKRQVDAQHKAAQAAERRARVAERDHRLLGAKAKELQRQLKQSEQQRRQLEEENVALQQKLMRSSQESTGTATPRSDAIPPVTGLGAHGKKARPPVSPRTNSKEGSEGVWHEEDASAQPGFGFVASAVAAAAAAIQQGSLATSADTLPPFAHATCDDATVSTPPIATVAEKVANPGAPPPVRKATCTSSLGLRRHASTTAIGDNNTRGSFGSRRQASPGKANGGLAGSRNAPAAASCSALPSRGQQTADGGASGPASGTPTARSRPQVASQRPGSPSSTVRRGAAPAPSAPATQPPRLQVSRPKSPSNRVRGYLPEAPPLPPWRMAPPPSQEPQEGHKSPAAPSVSRLDRGYVPAGGASTSSHLVFNPAGGTDSGSSSERTCREDGHDVLLGITPAVSGLGAARGRSVREPSNQGLTWPRDDVMAMQAGADPDDSLISLSDSVAAGFAEASDVSAQSIRKSPGPPSSAGVASPSSAGCRPPSPPRGCLLIAAGTAGECRPPSPPRCTAVPKGGAVIRPVVRHTASSLARSISPGQARQRDVSPQQGAQSARAPSPQRNASPPRRVVYRAASPPPVVVYSARTASPSSSRGDSLRRVASNVIRPLSQVNVRTTMLGPA